LADWLTGNTCVVGLQWGDEGKGKIVDVISEQADVVVRYCGGANAGHSVVINGQKYSTHLLPVGVFRPHTMSLIGNGVVLDPQTLVDEIETQTANGFAVTPANLRVSYKAHVVMPYHKAEDGAREAASSNAIGTTRRGIGPTYADKMHRSTAIRVADLIRPERLRDKLESIVADRNKVFAALYDLPPMAAGPIYENYVRLGETIAPFVDDTGKLLIDAMRSGKRVVFEGAHAVLLDIDHGTFPYVTSSACSALGLYTGAGAPPNSVRNFVGIMKAYSTRVGGGPFPTEQDNEIGHYIRERGNEYGTTTRRPRRCGWFDAMAVKYSVDLCGVTSVALTLLDVLSGLDAIEVCTGYTVGGEPLDYFRADLDTLAEVEPVYETLDGWTGDLTTCRRYSDLPSAARAYVERLETLIGAPIGMVSVGADRDATIER
jgi:adenylosuccinate synthase